MDIKSKYNQLKSIFNDVSFVEEHNSKNYRNRNLCNYGDIVEEKLNSIFSINFIKNISKCIPKTNFKIISFLIKENSKNNVLIKFNIRITNNKDIINDLLAIKKILLYHSKKLEKTVTSIHYQRTNNNKNPCKEDEYIKLYGNDDLIEYYDDFNLKIYISPDSFSRINYPISIKIYQYINDILIKNITNNLILLGRDINVPSLLLNKYFDNVYIYSHCKLIFNDLKKNKYIKNTIIYNESKNEISSSIKKYKKNLH